MPSAANVKIDKQISPENALADTTGNSSTPLRQAITIIEHKIRNLEKRKSKLESYKELQNTGKELNSDQKTALAKINEVIQTLDFARDLHKQFLGIASVTEKEAKKQAKRDAALKSQSELARLREILLVQDALNQMCGENVRDDFLSGRNGAAQLTDTDLKLLDDLRPAVVPKHEAGNPTAFANEVQTAAEHLLAVVDGKPKEVFGGSYSQVKEILGKIHESGYFDQSQVFDETEDEIVEQTEMVTVENHEIPQEPPQQPEQPSQVLPTVQQVNLDVQAAVLPPHQPLPAELQPPIEQQQQQQQQVLTPEQMYYQQVQMPPPPAPQPLPMRPITEMLGTGSFFFLQESEIDEQTFPNQQFVSNQQPPPMQLPPHFQQLPPANHHPGNHIDDVVREVDDKPVVVTAAAGVARATNNLPNNQSFYQNNNGYSNRPRQPMHRPQAARQ